MRRVLLFFMCCMVLSNIGNAAMLCCADVGKAQNIHLSASHLFVDSLDGDSSDTAQKPCHDTLGMNPNQAPDAIPDCECQNCLSFNGIFYQVSVVMFPHSVLQFVYTPRFLSGSPNVIYYPPKRLS